MLIKDFELGLDLKPITFLLLSQANIFVPMLPHFGFYLMVSGILVAGDVWVAADHAVAAQPPVRRLTEEDRHEHQARCCVACRNPGARLRRAQGHQKNYPPLAIVVPIGAVVMVADARQSLRDPKH